MGIPSPEHIDYELEIDSKDGSYASTDLHGLMRLARYQAKLATLHDENWNHEVQQAILWELSEDELAQQMIQKQADAVLESEKNEEQHLRHNSMST